MMENTLASVAGFEPTNTGIKVQGLPVWRHRNTRGVGFEPTRHSHALSVFKTELFIQLEYPRIKWTRWDSNPEQTSYEDVAITLSPQVHIEGAFRNRT